MKFLAVALLLFTGLAGGTTLSIASEAPLTYSVVEGADAVPLLVAEGGTPNGPAILFIHGMSQSHLSWRPQFDSRLAQSYRLIAFDMRGHGGSGKPWRVRDYSAKRKVWAKDVAAIIKAKGLDDVTIVAWSFGGHVAMSYVRAYGTKRLRSVNLSGTLAGLIDFPRTQSADYDKIMEGSRQRGGLNLADNITGYSVMPNSFTYAPMPAADLEIAVATGLMNPSYVRRAMTDLPLFNTDLVSKLNIPILITVGAHDEEWPVSAAQALSQDLPNSALSLYAQSGHFPSMEEPERFNCELAALVEGKNVEKSCTDIAAFSSAPTKAQVRARYAGPPSQFIEIDGVEMHYRDEGLKGEDRPVLILLPGHMGSLHMYDKWLPYLTPQFRVIRLDWPPYGLSLPDPSGVYSSPRGAELVIGFLDKMGIKRASLIGTSNGATVAAHVAAMRPDLVERMALSTFPLGAPPKRVISPELLSQAKQHMSNQAYRPYSLFKAILEDIFYDANNVTPERIREYTDTNNHPGGYDAQAIYIKNNRAMYDAGGLPALYAKITAPTLIQWGDGGIVMPANLAQGSADVLTNAPVVLLRYPEAGHMPMIEQPKKTATDLIAFLNGALDEDARAAAK